MEINILNNNLKNLNPNGTPRELAQKNRIIDEMVWKIEVYREKYKPIKDEEELKKLLKGKYLITIQDIRYLYVNKKENVDIILKELDRIKYFDLNGLSNFVCD